MFQLKHQRTTMRVEWRRLCRFSGSPPHPTTPRESCGGVALSTRLPRPRSYDIQLKLVAALEVEGQVLKPQHS